MAKRRKHKHRVAPGHITSAVADIDSYVEHHHSVIARVHKTDVSDLFAVPSELPSGGSPCYGLVSLRTGNPHDCRDVGRITVAVREEMAGLNCRDVLSDVVRLRCDGDAKKAITPVGVRMGLDELTKVTDALRHLITIGLANADGAAGVGDK